MVFAGLISSLWATSFAVAQPIRINISDPTFRPMRVAVPELVRPAQAPPALAHQADKLLELLRLDIDMMRHFDVLPPKGYLARGRHGAHLGFGPWRDIGARGLVRGSIEQAGGAYVVTLMLDDVAQNKPEVLKRICRVDADHLPSCTQAFVDSMVQWLTGEPGIFTSRVAFVRKVGRDKQIFTVDPDGSNLEKTVSEGHLSLLPAWDPSGQYLVFTSFALGNTDLFRLARPTGHIEPISQRKGLNVGAQISPDGKRIVMTLSKDGNAEIYVMDWDGKNLTRLTNSFGQDVSATWSPDSKRLAFVSSRAGSPQIHVMDQDGKNVRRLTFRGTYNQEPDWSPRTDGKIVFTARDEKLRYDIFAVHPESGAITRLTEDAGDNQSPSHSPDGQHLVFVSTRDRGAASRLYVMDIDGKDPRCVLPDQPGVETPAWGPRLRGP